MRTGLSTQTEKRYVFGPGAVFVNYLETGERLLGATQGGSTMTITTTYRDVPVDGALGMVKGLRRIVLVAATLQLPFLELSRENLLLQLPGATNTPDATHDVITRAGTIVSADHVTNVALLADKAGTTEPFIAKILNAMAQGGLSLGFAGHDSETVPQVTFDAFFDPSTPGNEPWEVRSPLAA